jgi:hypothetical protein
MKLSKSFLIPVLLLLISIVFGYFLLKNTGYENDKHFSLLANAFIKGDLFLDPINLPRGDYADFRARQYVFHGPMSAVLISPGVYIFGKNFPQITLSLASLSMIYISIFFISKKITGRPNDSMWLANFFVFGTTLYLTGLLNISAYIAQLVGTAFVVLAILEYFTKRRWLLIGILIAAAGLSRTTLYLTSIFFILEIIRLRSKISLKSSLVLFIIPVLISSLIWGGYNYRRFSDVFETGYKYNTTLQNWPLNSQLKYGLFNIKYFPTNIYSMLIRGPIPILEKGDNFILKYPYLKTDGWGMAIWITSPLLLYLIKLKKDKFTRSAIVAIIALSILPLTYFGIGFSQVGYRYSLDFMPFLFLILIPIFKNSLPKLAKFLIFFGILFNFYIIYTTYLY